MYFSFILILFELARLAVEAGRELSHRHPRERGDPGFNSFFLILSVEESIQSLWHGLS